MLPGEKLHEILISEEELPRAEDLGGYYVVQPHWMKYTGQSVQREYSSAENLLHHDEEIVALLQKSDAEFVRLGMQGALK